MTYTIAASSRISPLRVSSPLDLLVKVDVVMIENLAFSMVAVYAVAVLAAFVAPRVTSFHIIRHITHRS